MLCIKLGAVIRSRDMLEDIVTTIMSLKTEWHIRSGSVKLCLFSNRQYSRPVVPLLIHIVLEALLEYTTIMPSKPHYDAPRIVPRLFCPDCLTTGTKVALVLPRPDHKN
jgi:hypothetical protein